MADESSKFRAIKSLMDECWDVYHATRNKLSRQMNASARGALVREKDALLILGLRIRALEKSAVSHPEILSDDLIDYYISFGDSDSLTCESIIAGLTLWKESVRKLCDDKSI